MNIIIEYNKQQLEQLIKDDICKKLNTETMKWDMLSLQVKSKQNYKSEWEDADFKATYRADIP